MTTHALSPADRARRLVRVLIVDDMPQVLHDLRLLLELSGAVEVVGEARDGQEAIRLCAKLSPEVIVMDLEMRGMDGYEATRQIKARDSSRRVVILSVHADLEQRERARIAGADDFVVKGDNYEILVNAILRRNSPPSSISPQKGPKK